LSGIVLYLKKYNILIRKINLKNSGGKWRWQKRNQKRKKQQKRKRNK